MNKVLTRNPNRAKAKTPAIDVAAWRNHAICRGDFAALVFCGSSNILGELPGEPTAHTIYNFALPDTRLDASEDFARSPGMPLRLWPSEKTQPTPGVCFVFADSENPLVDRLRNAGGIEHEHFVVLESPQVELNDDLAKRLASFVVCVPREVVIGLLGYGHQGALIAGCMVEHLGVAADRLLVLDGNPESRAQAVRDGFPGISDGDSLLEVAGGVIYSPLVRYERLFSICKRAEELRVPVFDNTKPRSELRQFTARGFIELDGVASRALAVQDGAIQPQAHGLTLTCSIVREDIRRINGVQFPHLHCGHRITLNTPDSAFNLTHVAPNDPLGRSTFVESHHAFVSLRDRADLGFFAARDLCERLWPDAAHAVFPSEHVIDLGVTAFERLLQGHLDARELVSTMQTPAQRVTLGIAAAHFSHDRPIVEIGSAYGGSALLMAAATERNWSAIYSIDPETSTRDIMRFAFERHGYLDRLQQIIQPSDRAITQLKHLRGKAGLVFIDGLHTEEGVSSDFENYAPLVAPGGALVFHDVAPQIYSVFRFVIERVLTDRRFEALCLVDGLMVFRRRERNWT